MKAMEFGAGTGILSFLLAGYFSEITMMDSSLEMIKVMQEKAEEKNLNHLVPLFFDLETEDYSGKAFNCIYSQMAMHHVTDTEKAVNRFNNMLLPGGWLAIADLYPEDGSFHGEGFTGHNGFDTEELQNILQREGFLHIKVQNCFIVKKMIGGKLREYPLFLMTAQKPVNSK